MSPGHGKEGGEPGAVGTPSRDRSLLSLAPLAGRQVGSGAVVRHVHGDQSAGAEGGTGGRWGPCHLLGGSPRCQRLADTALPRSHV